MSEGIALQVSLTCPHCHQPVHVQGLGEVEICASCQNAVPLPVERWLGWFGAEEIHEALTLPEGEARQISSFGGTSAKYAYGHRMPRCQSCKTDVPAEQLPQLAAAGHWACTCGETLRVRAANDIGKVMVPGARWLVNEGHTGSEAAEQQPATEPVMFQCMACAGALTIDGTQRTVTCRYCGGSNFLPDALWLRMHPPQTVRTFFVVLEAGADGPPVELLERLAQADDSDVREAAAANPALPIEVLERLASDDDDDVREAVALNTSTPLPTVLSLLKDSDWEVRRAAVRSGRATEDALAELVRTESDSDVLEALGQVGELGPTLLRALGTSDQWRSRVVAAKHPDTPAEVLLTLASDSDSDVLEGLSARSSLPDQAIMTLAVCSRTAIAEAAQARPEYRQLLASRRKRKLGLAAVTTAVVLAVAGGTGVLALLGLAVRWAMRHL